MTDARGYNTKNLTNKGMHFPRSRALTPNKQKALKEWNGLTSEEKEVHGWNFQQYLKDTL